jgi:type II secretory pathway pseudopilin PulG
MKKQFGFTLIEVVLFIIVIGILGSTILISFNTILQTTPALLQNTLAGQTAKQCIEWFIGQRRLNGYSSITCPSSSVPSFCSTPTGYTLAVDIVCTTINSDANYKTITVTVSNRGDASLSTLVANY